MQSSQTEEKRQPQLLSILIILATVSVLGVSGWALIEAARAAPNLVSSLVAGLLAIGGIVAGRMYESRKRIEQERRERLSPIYERLMKLIYAVTKSSTRATDRKTVQTMEELSQLLMLWGTPSMIRAFYGWRAEIAEIEDDPRLMMRALERLLFAIRADLRSPKLDEGDLLRIFLNDYDEVMGPTSVEYLPISDQASVKSHRRRDAA